MPNKDKENRSKSTDASDSATDRTPVDSALERNAGIDSDKEPHPGGYQGLSEDTMAEEPPYAAPGVGGRTSPRAEDEPWTPSEGTPGMGSKPKPTHQSVASPALDTAQEEPPVVLNDAPYTEDAREEYIDRMKANLEERGVDIKALMSQAEGADATVRSAYLQQLENLHALQETASGALQTLMGAGGSTWRSVADNVDKAYNDLRSAVDSTMARIRGGREKDEKK